MLTGPVTVVGPPTATEYRGAGTTVTLADLLLPVMLAVTVDVLFEATPFEIAVKFALVEPERIVTEVGTVSAFVFELDSETTVFEPVAATNLTVAVAELPP